MPSQDKFTFRKHATIGAAAAEEDKKFLAECFVDIGDLEPLADCTDRRRIVLGRTGAGKSALLQRLIEEKSAIVINPETLSFNYLTNSTILQFFLEAGVKLDLFFKLLWRHVFTVELLKARYNIHTQTETQSLFEAMKGWFLKEDKHKKRAIDYLSKWSDQFWEDTEYRIKEITQKIEEDLKASVAGTIPIANLQAGAASKLSQEEKLEVIQRGKTVINTIQMRELTDVLEFLDENVFSDEKQHFYICIDRLDENWVDETFRYMLIRSLIETIGDFRRVRNIKIVAALRTDLIERVFRFTRDSGFQEEKYRSLYLPLRWSLPQLLSVLDRRVNYLVRQTYTKKVVGYADMLPASMGKKLRAEEYFVERTLMRPRELIEFFNCVIELAASRPTITKEMILQGEAVYSKNRMRSLQDEWMNEYPTLIDCSKLLKKRPQIFKLETITQDEVEDFCLENAVARLNYPDLLSTQARGVAEGVAPWSGFLFVLMHVFYLTGMVGLKTESFETFQWVHEGTSTIVADTIDLDTSVNVQPMFHRVLGIRPK